MCLGYRRRMQEPLILGLVSFLPRNSGSNVSLPFVRSENIIIRIPESSYCFQFSSKSFQMSFIELTEWGLPGTRRQPSITLLDATNRCLAECRELLDGLFHTMKDTRQRLCLMAAMLIMARTAFFKSCEGFSCSLYNHNVSIT